MSERGESLAKHLGIGDVDHDALVTILTMFFPSGEWHDGNTVTYRMNDGRVGLILVYGRKGGLQDVKRGPALTDDMLASLRGQISALGSAETIISREVFFNVLRVDGFWRYRDEWQIVPAPPQAPRSHYAMADHPFVIEIHMPWYRDNVRLIFQTRERRAWELLLLLNLVSRTQITRIGPRNPDHFWAFVDGQTRYVQRGYLIPDWAIQSDEFTATKGIAPLAEIPDDEYRRRRGIGDGDVFEIPAVLRPLLDQYHAVAPETRERFLRACYFYERSGAAWSMSVSLGHIAAVMTIEALMPAGAEERCPTCGLNLAAGVTRRFREFVEQYGSATTARERREIYKLRSALVHHGHLLDIDAPGPWGALIPRQIEQVDTYETARTTAQAVVVNWLLSQ